ncbi:MAG: ribosomal RNA small subunit methyltransferase A [Blastocatellia bacterium]|nr:ribosomal RNA small subunit methyltransferase A [Blastocatellia bacterium]
MKRPHAKRSLGQNFLVDPTYIQRIISAVNPHDGDTIVEIGPGQGALTRPLVESGAKVILLELDREFAAELGSEFQENSKVTVIETDASKVDFGELLGDQQAKLVANLPYNVSTAILQQLCLRRSYFTEMVLMFQREVVERIAAVPGSSERGFLTVLVERYLDVQHLFDVPPAAFRPRPKVTSSVARIVPREAAAGSDDEFRRLISWAFAQKRKTILNNLKGVYGDAAEKLEASGIEPGRRAETLSLDDWELLLKSLKTG